MAKNKLTIDFKGFEEYYEKLDKLQQNTRSITEEALEKSFKEITPGIEAAIRSHRDTGKTEGSLVKDVNVEWSGTVGSVDVGFNIENGGLPSIFLMYGTPKHVGANQYGKHGKNVNGIPQDMPLYNSIYGTSTRNKVRKVQQEVFDKALSRVF